MDWACVTGPPDRADLREKALDRSRRDLRARGGSQVEHTASGEVVEEVAVPASEIRLGDRLHPRGGAAAAQAHMRSAGLLPGVTISLRPARKGEGPHRCVLPILEPDVLAHDLPEALTRLGRLQPDVEVDRGLDVPVPQHAANPLVVPGIVPGASGRRRHAGTGAPSAAARSPSAPPA